MVKTGFECHLSPVYTVAVVRRVRRFSAINWIAMKRRETLKHFKEIVSWRCPCGHGRRQHDHRSFLCGACALCGDAWRSLPANRTESANDVCVRRRSMSEGRMSTAIVGGSDTTARRFIATMWRKQYAQWRLTATTCLLLGAVEFPKMWLE